MIGVRDITNTSMSDSWYTNREASQVWGFITQIDFVVNVLAKEGKRFLPLFGRVRNASIRFNYDFRILWWTRRSRVQKIAPAKQLYTCFIFWLGQSNLASFDDEDYADQKIKPDASSKRKFYWRIVKTCMNLRSCWQRLTAWNGCSGK